MTDPFQLSASSLDPCVAVAMTARNTVPIRQYGLSATWKLEDGGQRIDSLQIASSLAPDGGQPIRFCFAPEGVRTAVAESISIQYRPEYIETMTTGAGQPCMVLDVDGRFTSVIDAGGCQPIDAGGCPSDDAGPDGVDASSLAETPHAVTHTAAACSVDAGPCAGDVGFALVVVVAAVFAARRAAA